MKYSWNWIESLKTELHKILIISTSLQSQVEFNPVHENMSCDITVLELNAIVET